MKDTFLGNIIKAELLTHYFSCSNYGYENELQLYDAISTH